MIPLGILAAQVYVGHTGPDPDPGGDCDPYVRPSPGGVMTNLNVNSTWLDEMPIETNLCNEVV